MASERNGSRCPCGNTDCTMGFQCHCGSTDCDEVGVVAHKQGQYAIVLYACALCSLVFRSPHGCRISHPMNGEVEENIFPVNGPRTIAR